MVSSLLHPLLNQHGLVVYAVVGVLVFAEAAILFGFVFPGETAVILGGVIASRGHVSLPILMAIVVVAAIVGDSVGYWVGQRFGPRILEMRVIVKRQGLIDSSRRFLHKRGGWAVFIGRFTAFLRAMMPGLAGMSEMHYRTFLPANAAGGIIWGIGFAALGYVVGNAYTRLEQYASWASYTLLALIVAGVITLSVRRRRRERRINAASDGSDSDSDSDAGATPPDADHVEV
jgi:membrane protein DedA with SNARE-associated domain